MDELLQSLFFIETMPHQHFLRFFAGEPHFHELAYFALIDGWVRVLLDPFPRVLLELLAVALVLGGYHCVLGVVGLGGAEQGLQGQQGSPDRQRGGPLVLEDVQADGPGLRRDVGVPYFGFELHFGRLVRVLGRQHDIDLVESVLVDGVLWPRNVPLPVQVIPLEDGHFDIRLL